MMGTREGTRAVLGLIAAMGLLLASPASGRLIDRVVAVVNQQPILLSEVDALCRFQLEEVPASLPLDEAVERKRRIRLETLQTLIDEKLLAQEVRERKIEIPEEKIEQYIEQLRKDNNLTAEQFRAALEAEGKSLEQYRRMLREMFEKRALMQRELQGKAVVSEQDIQDYYRKHYVGGAGAEKIKASHILVAVPPDASAETQRQARRRAERILAELRAGADFAAMAEEHSDDPSASLGGDLGWFRRGDMVAAFENAALALDEGQMSDLVRTRFGFHIILVTGKQADQPPALEEVRAEIQHRLMKDLERKLMRRFLDDLRRRSYIDIRL